MMPSEIPIIASATISGFASTSLDSAIISGFVSTSFASANDW